MINKSLLDVPAVNGDEGELVQVFLNLLINAGQAIGIDGEIQLITQEIDHGVEIQVSDNGCGIEKGSLLKIFDPFYTTKDVGKGTGLGLALVFSIVENGLTEEIFIAVLEIERNKFFVIGLCVKFIYYFNCTWYINRYYLKLTRFCA